MGLSIGIIGLPNVGKSTVFNALTGAQNAAVANYPFCTIQPNRAIVPVPDERIEKITELVNVPNTIHATIEFVDIAGLVKGASKGEGLGNQFLGQIRDTDAIVHVVRCFDDPNVIHISEYPSPGEDIEIINLELALADLQQLERKIERLTSAVKGDKKLIPMLNLAQELARHLQIGQPVTKFTGVDEAIFKELNREMRFLTGKPMIIAANVDETGFTQENSNVVETREIAARLNSELVVICAKLEEELIDMTEQERREFLQLTGANSSGLEQLIQKSFVVLNLISFFTKNQEEVRAWNIPRGTTAPKAAGTIHTDFERGFIKAEVVSYETFVTYGSDAALRSAGQIRQEGKEYIVQDGDVIYFRFNL